MNTPTTPHEPRERDELARLARVRTGVRAVLALGIAASVAANILHAQENPVGRLVAAWPPVALLLAIELLSRVPVHRPLLSAARLTATAAVAGIAAWVSYWHMVSVAIEYGETSTSAHLIPVSVDGLVVVASVCLVELAARINALTTTTTSTSAPADSAGGIVPVTEQARAGVVDPSEAGRVPAPRRPARARNSTATGKTAAAIARTRAAHPDWTAGQIAARVGVTDRTVRRHLNTPDADGPSATAAGAAEVATSGEEVAA